MTSLDEPGRIQPGAALLLERRPDLHAVLPRELKDVMRAGLEDLCGAAGADVVLRGLWSARLVR